MGQARGRPANAGRDRASEGPVPSAWVAELVRGLGAAGIFLLMVPESACIPVPSELTLMCAGFAVGRGWIALPVAVAAATAGNLVGSLIAYALGRWSLRLRLGRRAGAGLERSDSLLHRRGARAVFLARLMPLARTFISLPAGRARVPFGRFVAMTIAGCAVWSFGFILVGIAAGAGWQRLGPQLGTGLLVATLVVLAGVLVTRARRGGIG
jgi:membrane protein DedA with SNARE-associated domain